MEAVSTSAATAARKVVEISVPAAVWQDTIEFYTHSQKVAPDYAQYPPTAIFRPVGKDYEIHLNEVGALLHEDSPFYANVDSPQAVDENYHWLIDTLGAAPQIVPQDITVLLRKGHKLVETTLRLASAVVTSKTAAPDEPPMTAETEPADTDEPAAEAEPADAGAEDENAPPIKTLMGVLHNPNM